MQRVLGSVAARVDPSIHPLLTRASRGRQQTLVIVVTGDKGCAAASTPTSSRRGGFIAESRRPCTLGLVGRKGATSSAAAASTVLFEQIGIFQKLRFEDAQAIAQAAIDAFSRAGRPRDAVYNEFKSVMTQRVVVDQLLPIARASRRRRRARRSPAATASADRLSLRAVAAGDLQPAAAALRRGAGLSRAARIERRVLRRADDRDGHGDEELGGDDRQPDALHEQGAPGGDHARDHRSRVGRRRRSRRGRYGTATHGTAASRQDRPDHRPVVDVEFEAGHLPEIYNALRIVSKGQGGAEDLDVIVEVEQHLARTASARSR
jgi:hypothetical protein